jgi:hypothetical protein
MAPTAPTNLQRSAPSAGRLWWSALIPLAIALGIGETPYRELSRDFPGIGTAVVTTLLHLLAWAASTLCVGGLFQAAILRGLPGGLRPATGRPDRLAVGGVVVHGVARGLAGAHRRRRPRLERLPPRPHPRPGRAHLPDPGVLPPGCLDRHPPLRARGPCRGPAVTALGRRATPPPPEAPPRRHSSACPSR